MIIMSRTKIIEMLEEIAKELIDSKINHRITFLGRMIQTLVKTAKDLKESELTEYKK